MPKHRITMRTLVALPLLLLLAACANIGRPEGGPRDEMPPVFVSSNPKPGAVNVEVDNNRITAYFDENIQVEDAFTKVVVSPAMKTPPQVTANGRRLTVEFRDSLCDSTTYTVDFADAIKDLNEGNILDGFALDFSTGDHIDTLRISGLVLQAENLEPAQGMLVGVYSMFEDSAIRTLPLERIARTNQLGQFTIRNLPPGEYRVFAVNDLNRDYHWDRSEDVAFFDKLVSPSVEQITVTDTLFAADRSDSLVTRPGLRYLPNDIFMTWFNEGYRPAYLGDYKREERRRITINFAAPVDSAPQISIVDGAPGAGRLSDLWALTKANATGDSLELWLSDPDVVAADSLRLSVRYLKTDTLEQLVWTTDTLRFFFREPKKKKEDSDDEVPQRLFTVDSISGDTTFLPPQPEEFLGLHSLGRARQDIDEPLRIQANVPLASIDSAGVHFEELVDTVWTPRQIFLRPDSANLLMQRRIDVQWTPGAKYRLTIDSLAARSIYDTWNRPFKLEFTVANLEDYSNLRITLPGTDSLQTVLELLDSGDKPIARVVKPIGTEIADFHYLDPGAYYLRLIVDTNKNGKWDTGEIASFTQPEDVYYFAKKLTLKANWDVEQTWILDELPVDQQKPYAIKKNKPALKRGEEAPQEEEESWEDQQAEFEDPFTPRTNRNQRGSGGRNGMRRNTGVGTMSR